MKESRIKDMVKKATKNKAGPDIGCPQIATFRLDQLHRAEYNPRCISDQALAGLSASLQKFGCVEPIVVNIRGGKNRIVGGHQRYKALATAGIKRITCVTVNLAETDEKLLNLSLNNPHIQGRFVEQLAEHIDQLRSQISDEADYLDLAINTLRDELGNEGKTCGYKEENLKPFQQVHVLLSFPPQILPEIQENLEAIIKNQKVEYVQSSN